MCAQQTCTEPPFEMRIWGLLTPTLVGRGWQREKGGRGLQTLELPPPDEGQGGWTSFEGTSVSLSLGLWWGPELPGGRGRAAWGGAQGGKALTLGTGDRGRGISSGLKGPTETGGGGSFLCSKVRSPRQCDGQAVGVLRAAVISLCR